MDASQACFRTYLECEKRQKITHQMSCPNFYQGQEEISEEIIPLLRQFDFYWIIKMGYLKINASLITVLIER